MQMQKNPYKMQDYPALLYTVRYNWFLAITPEKIWEFLHLMHIIQTKCSCNDANSVIWTKVM